MPSRPISRALFDYDITEDRIIIIIDFDQEVSVSSDIENVLADIAQAEHLASLSGYRVVYRDPMQRWDGVQLDPAGRFRSFYSIGATDEGQAVARERKRPPRSLAAR